MLLTRYCTRTHNLLPENLYYNIKLLTYPTVKIKFNIKKAL